MGDKLNITFHNPNNSDELINALIRISAEIAKETVTQKIAETDE